MRLDKVSGQPARFPRNFFGPELQGMLNGRITVGEKPAGYYPSKVFRGDGAGMG